jgi:hypothetical protein
MPRLRRYLPPLVILLPLIFVCGNLLLTPVKTGYEGPGFRLSNGNIQFGHTYEVGWPWVYRDFEEAQNPQFPVSPLRQTFKFSSGVLLADLAMMLTGLLLGAAVVRRWSRERHRWLQFSLRGLLCAIGIVALICGWFTHQWAEWRREQRALSKLEFWEATPKYLGPRWLLRFIAAEKLSVFHRIEGLMDEAYYFRGDRPVDRCAQALQDGLPELRFARNIFLETSVLARVRDSSLLASIEEVTLYNAGDQDRVMELLGRCERLEILTIGSDVGMTLSDAGLAELAKSTTLEELRIREGQFPNITDRGVAQLARLPRLRKLALPAAPITDAAMKLLSQCRTLESLAIGHCQQLTDDGLRHLLAMPNLSSVEVPCPPQISDALLRQLLQKLPNVTVVHPHGVKSYSNGKRV